MTTLFAVDLPGLFIGGIVGGAVALLAVGILRVTSIVWRKVFRCNCDAETQSEIEPVVTQSRQ